MRRRHWFGAFIALVVAYLSVLQLFPNEEACVASGRTVDPTRRHCEGPEGYVQLREHVLFHSREGFVLVAVIAGVVYFIDRRRRRRAKAAIRLDS